MILTQLESTLAKNPLQGNLGRRMQERLENALEGASNSQAIPARHLNAGKFSTFSISAPERVQRDLWRPGRLIVQSSVLYTGKNMVLKLSGKKLRQF